jgi:hypothetical protein
MRDQGSQTCQDEIASHESTFNASTEVPDSEDDVNDGQLDADSPTSLSPKPPPQDKRYVRTSLLHLLDFQWYELLGQLGTSQCTQPILRSNDRTPQEGTSNAHRHTCSTPLEYG